jgi:hypothetical protein
MANIGVTICRLPLEGGGPSVMGLARPARTPQQARGRAKPLTIGVGVMAAREGLAAFTPT